VRHLSPTAEAIRGLVKQWICSISSLPASRIRSRACCDEIISAAYDRRATAKLVRQLDEERKTALEQLKHAVYFHRQVAWLQEHFPKAELQAVPGLVRLVDRKEIEAADWSLTPAAMSASPHQRRTRTSTLSRPYATSIQSWPT